MANLTVLANFDGTDGMDPSGGVIADAASDLFGVTSAGGAANDGVVYEIAKTSMGYASTPTVLASFDGVDGQTPMGALVADAAGDLFGTTSAGGAYNDGTVFELVKTSTGYASTPTILASLDDNTGFDPTSGLTIDAAGDLLGATLQGGTYDNGTVFEIAKTEAGYATAPTTLVSISVGGTSDFNLGARVTLDAEGDLFGTLEWETANVRYLSSELFEIVKNSGSSGYANTMTDLYYSGGALGPLVNGVSIDAAGDLFGEVENDSSATVFELLKTSAGYASQPTTLDDSILRAFVSGVTLDSHGDLFGVSVGPINESETSETPEVFEIAKTSAGYANTFTGEIGIDGNAAGALLVDAAGDLFGATTNDGTNGDGTVFEVTGLEAPTLAITSAGGLTNQTTQTIDGTIDVADAGLTVSIYDGTTLLGTATPAADGDWSASVMLLSTQGAQSITAQATNANGDVGTSPAVVYTLDTIPPTLTINDANPLPDSTAQTLAGSIDAADAGLTISIYDGTTLVGTTTANGADLWIATVVLPAAGPYVLTAQATDPAGNLGVSNTVELASGGGQTFDLAPNLAASLYDTGGDWDRVNGVGGTVYLTSAQVESFNSELTIDFAGGTANAAAVYDTDASWDYVNGNDGLVVLTQANVEVTGGGDAVYFEGPLENLAALYETNGNWDSVNAGPNGAEVVLTDAFAEVTGAGSTVYFEGTSGNAAALYNTGVYWDEVTGSNGEVVLTAAFAEVFGGGGNAIYFEGSSANAAALYNTGGVFDGVTGSNGEVVLTNAQAEVVGGGNSIYLEGAAADTAALYNTGTNADAVTGSNGLLVMTNTQATVTGSSDTIYLVGANTVTQNGASDAFVFQPAIGEDVIGGFSSTDTMQFSASDFANFAALQSHISQSGANTVITLDASDTVTLTNVLATSLSASQFHFG